MTAAAPATLLVAAGVLTLDDALDAARPRALVVEGGRITWVGPDPAAAPPVARSVDLGDAWITPAFVDAHVHGTLTGQAAEGVDLSGVGSAAHALDLLRRHAAERDAPVVYGDGWDSTTWPEGRPPTADELAAAAPGRRVFLARVDQHSSVVDRGTLALLPLERLAGVDRAPDGTPTGWLREEASAAARSALRSATPPRQLDAARQATCERAAGLGIGTLHEMGHPGLSGLDDAMAWRDGDWPLRVLVWWAELEWPPPPGLRPGGDLFLDGSIGSHTAAVSRYLDHAGVGELFHTDDAVAEFFTAATREGMGAGVHCIGDRAIAQALRAIDAAAASCGVEAVRQCRHRLEHVELPTRDDVERMAALGLVASVQPAFDATWGGPAGLYTTRFGRDAALSSNPFAWFAAAGVPLALSSDSTVTPLDPWGAVAAAEQHQGGLGVPRRAALAAHTRGGWLAGQDPDGGRLVPGAAADLAVWDAAPLVVADVRALRCLATMVRGRCVHGDVLSA